MLSWLSFIAEYIIIYTGNMILIGETSHAYTSSSYAELDK